MKQRKHASWPELLLEKLINMKIDTSLVKSGMSAAGTFIKETRAEAKKVVWPDRKYVTAATVIILIIIVLTSVFVTSVDYMFGKIFETLMRAR